MSSAPQTSIVNAPITSAAATGLNKGSQLVPAGSPAILTGDKLLVAQAVSLLIQLDRDLTEARAQFNQDWFRRLMRARRKAVERLRRRWSKIVPSPKISLGSLRRKYHAHVANYLYGT